VVKKFEISDYFIFSVFFVSLYINTLLIGYSFLLTNVYYFQTVLFLLYLIVRFDAKSFLNFKLPKVDFLNLEIFLMLFVFFISSFVVNYSNNSDPISLIKLSTYPIIFILFFFTLAKKIYNDNGIFEKLMNAVLYLGIAHSLISVFIFLAVPSLNSTYSFSITGLFRLPNTTSFIYTALIPILLYKYFTKQINFYIFAVIFVLFLFCLLFTYSRSGYLAFSVILLVSSYSKSKKVFFISLILLLVIIGLFFADFATSKTDSSVPRFLLYITAIDMIFRDINHFFWGYGVIKALDLFIEEKMLFGSFEQVISPHNFIFLLSLQFGALMPVSFLIFVITIYVRTAYINTKKIIINRKMQASLCIVVTLSLIIQSLLEDILAYPEFFVMPIFLTFLGYLYYYIKNYLSVMNE
jgi:hypothetical protein